MRILVVHHGPLPTPGSPCTGGARRAAVHVEALRRAGHTVVTIAREQDEEGGFRSHGDLRRKAALIAPDWILCVAPEEAPALAPVAPLVVDLYAPRMLEGAFEGLQDEEVGRALAALEAADEVLFSNPRQRWFWSGLCGAVGWDLSRPVGLLVPLAAIRYVPPSPALPPKTGGVPRFVIGGKPWPWQDAGETLRRAVAHLGDRAEVVSVGLPAVAGVRALPAGSLDDWLALCASSTAALDRYAPNPERALAMSFRQMDYLGAGLPLITDPDTPLAEAVRETRAGWVDEPLEEALDAAIVSPRDSNRLAARFDPSVTEGPLLAWQPARRVRGRSWARAGARLAAAERTAAKDRALRETAEAEVAAKRAEVAELNGQLRALTSSVEALSAAMADVAGFRRETVQVLGTRLSAQTGEAEHLRRELEIVRADLEKKNLEIGRLTAERDRLALPFLRRPRT